MSLQALLIRVTFVLTNSSNYDCEAFFVLIIIRAKLNPKSSTITQHNSFDFARGAGFGSKFARVKYFANSIDGLVGETFYNFS